MVYTLRRNKASCILGAVFLLVYHNKALTVLPLDMDRYPGTVKFIALMLFWWHSVFDVDDTSIPIEKRNGFLFSSPDKMVSLITLQLAEGNH